MPTYRLTKSRYIDGQFIFASPEQPASVELPEGTKVDSGLQPMDAPAVEKAKPHYAVKTASVVRAHEAAKPVAKEAAKGAKRATDTDAL